MSIPNSSAQALFRDGVLLLEQGRLPDAEAAAFDGVIRWDLEAGTSTAHRYGEGQLCGETVHAPDPDDPSEASGWLLNFVHDLPEDRSSMVVLDAETLDEVARVHLPRRVPFGFHGSWLPAEG